jgi:hypothetical protein
MYIYIIREREFRRFGEPVWKPGRTEHESIQKRFSQYPKGSELIFAASVSDAVAAEKELMQLLASHRGLIHRKDIGREYFEGELEVIYGIASMVCARYIKAADWEEGEENEDENKSDSNQSEDTLMDVDDAGESVTDDEPAQDPPLDSHMAIIQFVSDHRQTLNRANMTVADVYRVFKLWLDNQSVLPQVVSMQSKTLSQSICKLYKAQYSTICLPDGQLHPSLRFPTLFTDASGDVGLDNPEDFISNWIHDNIQKTDETHEFIYMRQVWEAFRKLCRKSTCYSQNTPHGKRNCT